MAAAIGLPETRLVDGNEQEPIDAISFLIAFDDRPRGSATRCNTSSSATGESTRTGGGRAGCPTGSVGLIARDGEAVGRRQFHHSSRSSSMTNYPSGPEAEASAPGRALNGALGVVPIVGAEATNGDGFGIGWYDKQPEPGLFKSIEPAWNDQNLREVASHITSGHFFAHIRAAIGSAVQQTNCHPFRHGRWLFMHNGFIADFARVKRDLMLAVDESLYPHCWPGRHRGPVLPSAYTRAAGRSTTGGCTRDRHGRGCRAPQGHDVALPGYDRDHRRPADVDVSLLQPRKVPVAVLLQARRHAP